MAWHARRCQGVADKVLGLCQKRREQTPVAVGINAQPRGGFVQRAAEQDGGLVIQRMRQTETVGRIQCSP